MGKSRDCQESVESQRSSRVVTGNETWVHHWVYRLGNRTGVDAILTPRLQENSNSNNQLESDGENLLGFWNRIVQRILFFKSHETQAVSKECGFEEISHPASQIRISHPASQIRISHPASSPNPNRLLQVPTTEKTFARDPQFNGDEKRRPPSVNC